MCDDCLGLLGQEKKTPPHPHLELLKSAEIGTEYATTLEVHRYKCGKCGQSWTFEGGLIGNGWKI